MKRLHGQASASVAATTAECLSILAAIDGYPAWHPDVVRRAEIQATGQNGLPTRAHVTLHVSRGPLERDFDLQMSVSVEPPGRVTLARIPYDAADQDTFDVAWEVEEHGESRRVQLTVEAFLDVPRFLPLGTVGDDLAAGFVSALAHELRPGH